MTVEDMITKLVTLGPKYAKYVVDARVENGAIGDYEVTDLAEMDDSRNPGSGWVTLFLDEPSS